MDEERVAAGLLVHQARQRRHLRGRAVDGVGDQLRRGRASRSGPSTSASRRRARLAHLVQREHQRVRWADLVVAVGADEQQVRACRAA